MEVITQPLPLPLALVEAQGKFTLIVREGLLDSAVTEQLRCLLARVPDRSEAAIRERAS